MQKTVGVVIGRFQLPELHDGHKALINHVAKENDVVCVLVGVSPRASLKNLLPYAATASMIRGTFREQHVRCKIFVFPLQDVEGNDLQWSMEIDKFLQLLFPAHYIRLYAGRDSFKSSYHGRFQPVVDWFGYNGEVNGSAVRNSIIDGDPIDSKDFRAGIVYGLGNYLRDRDAQRSERLDDEGTS